MCWEDNVNLLEYIILRVDPLERGSVSTSRKLRDLYNKSQLSALSKARNHLPDSGH